MNQLDKILLQAALEKAKVDESKVNNLLQAHGIDVSMGSSAILYQMEILGLDGRFEINAPWTGLEKEIKATEVFIIADKKGGKEIDRVELTKGEFKIIPKEAA